MPTKPNLEVVSSTLTKGTYIDFRLHSLSPSGKTKTWKVQNRDNSILIGEVMWFSRWRKYIFAPYDGMVFEETCLHEIAMFCQQETSNQRKEQALRKKT